MDAWRAWAAAAASWAATRRAVPWMARVLEVSGLMRSRRQDGRPVPTAAGVGPLLVALGVHAATGRDPAALERLYAPALAAALAGLVDDAAGPGPRGWRGHLRALLHGRPGTGILKAAAIGAVAVAAAAGGRRTLGAGRGLLAAASSTFTASLLNQLDTGPGRACGAFLAGYAAVGLLARGPRRRRWLSGLPLAGAVAGYAPFDGSGRVMLGDSGANALGAALGWIAGECLPLGALGAWTAGVFALNVLLDRWSLSRWVELRLRRDETTVLSSAARARVPHVRRLPAGRGTHVAGAAARYNAGREQGADGRT